MQDAQAASSHLKRRGTAFSDLLNPFTPPKGFWPSLMDGLLATALFRCYHITLFFTAWATCVTLINQENIFALNFQPTLLTVVGTVLGFVISYRTTSAFERYNEGRQLWSQIILQSRTFARSVWFHIPYIPVATSEDQGRSIAELQARTLIEKKTVVNLIEGFAVSVKHYLRGEEGCHYEDLWPLVKFLPSYALPTALPSSGVLPDIDEKQETNGCDDNTNVTLSTGSCKSTASHLPLHVPTKNRPSITIHSPVSPVSGRPSPMSPTSGLPRLAPLAPPSTWRPSNYPLDEPSLSPSRVPPQSSYFDMFPFSLLMRLRMAKGKEVKGRKAARLRAKMGGGKRGIIDDGKRGTIVDGQRGSLVNHNIPLEITLYLSSYISALQHQKAIDDPTSNLLIGSLNGLVEALTGLERILTTPIPFSYSIHLWAVTTIYCLALPLQIWETMGWLTIPATSILTLIFFGFLVAGEEIENPFGYDKNDLDLDHFTHFIIRQELMAITSLPTPNPSKWAFCELNDSVFDARNLPMNKDAVKATPNEWVTRGSSEIMIALSEAMRSAQDVSQ